jgi:hypothetical protein
MFTTGLSDVHELDNVGAIVPLPRAWKISEIAYNLHIYTFGNPQANYKISDSLTKTIRISSTAYQCVNEFQLPNGSTVKASWPVGTQS